MRRVACVVFTLVLGVAAVTAHAQPALETVKVSEAVRGFFFVPLYVAHGRHFFTEEGLAVEIKTASGGPGAMQALVAGEVQFCATGHGQVANLFQQGKRTLVVNQLQHRNSFYLLGRPEVASIDALKGKKIGVTQVGAETYGLARFLVTKGGLSPDRDVDVVGVGGMDTMAAALESDRIQAAVAWQPLVTRLVSVGKARVLAGVVTETESRQYLGAPVYAFSVIIVSPEYAQKHRATVQKFVNAMVKAERWMQGQGPEEVVKALVPYFSAIDLDVLRRALVADWTSYSTNGIVSREGHDTAIKVFREAGILKADVSFHDIVDNTFSEHVPQ